MNLVYSFCKKFGLLITIMIVVGGAATSSNALATQNDVALLTTSGSGQILREWWSGVTGTTITSLTNDPNFPEAPSDSDLLSAFQTPSNWADNYGTRMRGYIHPPVDGTYTFWIASDDKSELWLSSDHNPANASRIANVPDFTNPGQWDKYASQQSVSIPLEAGQRYYIEALHKESGFGDHLSVAWQIPNESQSVIDGIYLSPFTRAFANVALNGSATQSSTRNSTFSYVASNAIDGNTDGMNVNNSISHTDEDFQAWWEVDLGENYYLDVVQLWNRTDCCEDRLTDFYVLVSEFPFDSQDLGETLEQEGVSAYFFDGQAGRSENIFTRAMGRFVRVQLTDTNFLNLAEVQVWGTAVSQTACDTLFQEADAGAFSGAFEVGIDPLANNGFYTHVPEDSPVEFFDGLSDNFMSYCVTIESAGLYQINSQIYAEDGGSNSFYVTIDDLPADGFIWDFEPITAVYAQDYVSDDVQGIDPYQLFLTAGEHTLHIYQREDGARLDWFEFELINNTPLVTNPGNQVNTVGENVSLQISASDEDGDTLSYSATDLPDGLEINSQTGLISGTVVEVGFYNVTIFVDDGMSGTTSITFNWTVEDLPNTPPVIVKPRNQFSTVGETVSLQIEASDADDDELAYSATGLPAGLTINEDSGLISGTLTTVQTRTVTVSVDDQNGDMDSTSFRWTVNESPNTPPELTQPANQTNIIGDAVSLQIEATDVDGQALTYEASGLPDGLSINGDTGLISGVLTAVQSKSVTIVVDDSNGGTASATFSWTVNDVPNSAPVVTNPGAQMGEKGDAVSLTITATDADNDSLQFGASGLPNGLSINTQSGHISGVLTAVGTFQVTVTADDGQESGQASFVWEVEEPEPPVVTEFFMYLPIIKNNVKLDEPNNSCAQAYAFELNTLQKFFHEDQEDWYRVTVSSPQNLQVALTNFTASGQIVVYRGSCANLVFLQNNGNFSQTKLINLPNAPAGTYFIRVITDDNYNEVTPYSLIVNGS